MSWRRGKRKEEEDLGSDGGSDGNGPAKKTSKTESDESDGIVVCEVSLNLTVVSVVLCYSF